MTLYTLYTFGRDRPGLVAGITRELAQESFSLDEARMKSLGKYFEMVMLVSGADDTAPLEVRLGEAKAELGLDVLHLSDGTDYWQGTPATGNYYLEVYGADRVGFVAEVSGVLADFSVNITTLESRIVGGPEGYAYKMEFHIEVEPQQVEALQVALNLRALDQGFDFDLSPTSLVATV
jgi:glycine cleavage system transcriptional repressor